MSEMVESVRDEWEPPKREIEARTFMGTETAVIAIKGSPSTKVRANSVVELGDMR